MKWLSLIRLLDKLLPPPGAPSSGLSLSALGSSGPPPSPDLLECGQKKPELRVPAPLPTKVLAVSACPAILSSGMQLKRMSLLQRDGGEQGESPLRKSQGPAREGTARLGPSLPKDGRGLGPEPPGPGRVVFAAPIPAVTSEAGWPSSPQTGPGTVTTSWIQQCACPLVLCWPPARAALRRGSGSPAP